MVLLWNLCRVREVYSANVEFLRALRKRCDEVDAVLIFDEIQVSSFSFFFFFLSFSVDDIVLLMVLVWTVSLWYALGSFDTTDRLSSRHDHNGQTHRKWFLIRSHPHP